MHEIGANYCDCDNARRGSHILRLAACLGARLLHRHAPESSHARLRRWGRFRRSAASRYLVDFISHYDHPWPRSRPPNSELRGMLIVYDVGRGGRVCAPLHLGCTRVVLQCELHRVGADADRIAS